MTAPRQVVLYAPVSLDPAAGPALAAARVKALGIGEALAAAGADVRIVTIQPGGPRRQRIGAVTVERVPTPGRRAIRRIGGTISLAWHALRHVPRGAPVIIYNCYPEYLGLALLRRLLGRPVTLDIEDGPTRAAATPLARFDPLLYRFFRRLAAPRVIAAAQALADALAVEAFALPGVATARAAPRRFDRPEVTVHLGGTLNAHTGIGLFRDALALLDREAPDAPLRFLVTGHLAAGEASLAGTRLRVATGLDDAGYRAAVAEVDVGLQLRLPGTELADTTFPSKAIEIAAAGRLLVSTRVSDVPALFGEEGAMLLPAATPRALTEALLAIAADRPAAARRAALGQQRIVDRLAPAHVGPALLAFLD